MLGFRVPVDFRPDMEFYAICPIEDGESIQFISIFLLSSSNWSLLELGMNDYNLYNIVTILLNIYHGA